MVDENMVNLKLYFHNKMIMISKNHITGML